MNIETTAPKLAPPFDRIFADRDEAEWGFDFLRQTLDLLNSGKNGYRACALTLPKHLKNHILRLNVGMWLFVDLCGANSRSGKKIHLTMLSKAAEELPYKKDGDFSPYNGVQASIFVLPWEDVCNMEKKLSNYYQESMRVLGELHANWRGSPYQHSHQSRIFDAIFDQEKRNHILRYGIDGKTVTDIDDTSNIENNDDKQVVSPSYTLADCADETGMDEATLTEWVEAIQRKGQGIIYGPPGTGKTFVAQRLARHLVSGGDGIIGTIQFHPSYTYEEFIQGIRPQTSSDGQLRYQLTPGRFLEFCQQAEQTSDTSVLIIDEINRANLSRVFGELMFLLEYRDQEMPLAGGSTLKIPPQLRIIGTMNTADRSIALVDHALRRRFAFLPLQPNFHVLLRYHEKKQTGFPVQKLVALLQQLNNTIDDPNYAVGISYFMRENLSKELRTIWRMEIQPYLHEYFFDRSERIKPFLWESVQIQLGLYD